MTHFERGLYADPDADHDTAWWDLVERFQLLTRPDGRHAPDWAAKIHVALAPVYYQNYLLGELVASQLQATLFDRFGGIVGRPDGRRVPADGVLRAGVVVPLGRARRPRHRRAARRRRVRGRAGRPRRARRELTPAPRRVRHARRRRRAAGCCSRRTRTARPTSRRSSSASRRARRGGTRPHAVPGAPRSRGVRRSSGPGRRGCGAWSTASTSTASRSATRSCTRPGGPKAAGRRRCSAWTSCGSASNAGGAPTTRSRS